MKRRYVISESRKPQAKPLPKDRWQGRTFIEANGVICEVVAAGKMPTEDWPHGSGCSLDELYKPTVGNPIVKP